MKFGSFSQNITRQNIVEDDILDERYLIVFIIVKAFDIVERFVEAGYISITGDRIALTERGFYVSNSILTELI